MSRPTADRGRPLPDPSPRPGPDPRRAAGPAGASAVTVRPGDPTDAARVAALHAGGIDEGFLTLLGTDFLGRLYRRICRHPASFLLVADEPGVGIVGFVAGSTDVSSLYRAFILRDGPAAATRAFGTVVKRWRQVLETVRHGSPGGRGSTGAELLAVAVDPHWQGRGAARLLVASFLREVDTRGCRAAQVVVGADNRRAIGLYDGAGFVTVERFELHSGTQSLLMRWEASGASASPEAVGG